MVIPGRWFHVAHTVPVHHGLVMSWARKPMTCQSLWRVWFCLISKCGCGARSSVEHTDRRIAINKFNHIDRGEQKRVSQKDGNIFPLYPRMLLPCISGAQQCTWHTVGHRTAISQSSHTVFPVRMKRFAHVNCVYWYGSRSRQFPGDLLTAYKWR